MEQKMAEGEVPMELLHRGVNTPPAFIAYAPSEDAFRTGRVDRTVRHLASLLWGEYDPVVALPSKLVTPPREIRREVRTELQEYASRLREGMYALLVVAGSQDTEVMCDFLRAAYAGGVSVSAHLEHESPLDLYYRQLFRRQ